MTSLAHITLMTHDGTPRRLGDFDDRPILAQVLRYYG